MDHVLLQKNKDFRPNHPTTIVDILAETPTPIHDRKHREPRMDLETFLLMQQELSGKEYVR